MTLINLLEQHLLSSRAFFAHGDVSCQLMIKISDVAIVAFAECSTKTNTPNGE